MKILRTVLLLAAVLLWSAAAEAAVRKSTDKVSVTLYTSQNQINPTQNLGVLIQFVMHDGWHIFAQNPGDIGLPTEVEWSLPQGWTLSEPQWSRFQKFETDGIVQYGYGKDAYYAAEIIPVPFSGSETVRVRVSWLACKDECIPESVAFELRLPATSFDLRPQAEWEKIRQTSAHAFAERRNLDISLCLAVLMAFAGGIILNFMPCIFPILTLKAIALVQQRNNLRESRIEALCYAAGVVICFGLAATLLLFLRLKGEQIGWGFQLQSPSFVGFMMAVFLIIGLMLLDVIQFPAGWFNRLGTLSFKRQRVNAFVTGFFAVLIASPCTAPFMGVAVGFALASPVYVYYPVFLALGLGYALPFALAGWFPQVLHKVLPRPGKWMNLLKKIFAVPVLLTCVWLGWLLYGQLHLTAGKSADMLQWEAYDAVKVEQLVRRKQPVFIDFTAKWCLTCLVNKQVALHSEAFERAVKEKNIRLFKADWTNRSDVIAAALESYGRSSIPLYVYYDGSSEYKILPQLLTPGIVADYLN